MALYHGNQNDVELKGEYIAKCINEHDALTAELTALRAESSWVRIESEGDLPKEAPDQTHFLVTPRANSQSCIEGALWFMGDFWARGKVITKDVIAYRAMVEPFTDSNKDAAGLEGDCPHGCHVQEPYGFVPMCGCPIHDPNG